MQTTPSGGQPTPFNDALDKYLHGLKGKRKKDFVDLCSSAGKDSPEILNDLLRATHATKRPNSRIFETFGRIADALKDYSEVIGQLASVKPLPLAIIWGSVRVVVDGVARCRDLYESMEGEFTRLATQMERIKQYKALFGQYPKMQELFFRTYTNMIRFWHRVHKECARNAAAMAWKAATSSATLKLKRVVDDLEKDLAALATEAAICHYHSHRDERDAASKDREAQAAERAAANAWRTKQAAVNSKALYFDIRKYLEGTSSAFENNENFYQETLKFIRDPESGRVNPTSCDWITQDEVFIRWHTDTVPRSTLLCLDGLSGRGKTVLTAFVIDHVMPTVPTLYFFCPVAKDFLGPLDPLKLVAAQLFNVYFSRGYPVSDELANEVLRSRSHILPEQLEQLITTFIESLGGAYLFVDGLDEVDEGIASHVTTILRLFIRLSDTFGGRVRLWCSFNSQMSSMPLCAELLERCIARQAVIGVTGRAEPHVEALIRSRIHSFEKLLASRSIGGAVSDSDRDTISSAADILVSRADGNFLWAHLMTSDFTRDGIRSASDLESHARDTGIPKKYDEIYDKHFSNRIAEHDRHIASKVMAILVYQRRHLCVGELREAVVATIRPKDKNLKAHLMTLNPEALLNFYSLHVQVDRGNDGSIDWSSTCRLAHDSVRKFLLARAVPRDGRPQFVLQITPRLIADACLAYIERRIYDTPLSKCLRPNGIPGWVDANNADVLNDLNHRFVQYAIKYWARHLEDVDAESFRKRVERFVSSANFQTLLQMQTLWVEGQFTVYSVGLDERPSVLRVLPEWLIKTPRTSDPLPKPWLEYIVLHHNWARVLSCGSCRDVDDRCPLQEHRGEIDRIWWGALGADHSFSSFKSRYPSYRLEQPMAGGPIAAGTKFEAVVICDAEIHLLRYSSKTPDGGIIAFVFERWQVIDYSSRPRLVSQQLIRASSDASHWPLYTKETSCAAGALYGAATAFSDDGRVLRIGSALFHRDTLSHEYRPLASVEHSDSACPPYFEEVAHRDGIIAIGSRLHSVATRAIADALDAKTLHADMIRLEGWAGGKRGRLDIDGDDDWETSSSSSDGHLEGFESWSEGSTENDDALTSEDDSSEEEDGSGSPGDSDSVSSDSSDEMSRGQGPAEPNSSDEEAPLDDTALPQFGELDSDDEELYWGKKMNKQIRMPLPTLFSLLCPPRRRPQPPSDDSGSSADSQTDLEDAYDARDEPPWMSLTILTARESGVVTRFHFRHSSTIVLYDSPPALHPREQLVVWPLGAGEILFADFRSRTYFIRKLRSSAPRTRHLSVKVHFSPCGKFVHIASLEAQISEIAQKVRLGTTTVTLTLPALRLGVFISTHRLSEHKTTRSPPTLVHRAKVDFGTSATINPSKLPFTFTWTDSALFVTRRDADLAVHNIPLFKSADKSRNGILVPKLKIFLPDNATDRAVHFIPKATDGTPAFIVLGSEPREPTNMSAVLTRAGATQTLRNALAPPICCILDEDRDLGEWVSAEDVRVPMGQGVGKLENRREKFDPVDDCDVAPYVRFV